MFLTRAAGAIVIIFWIVEDLAAVLHMRHLHKCKTNSTTVTQHIRQRPAAAYGEQLLFISCWPNAHLSVIAAPKDVPKHAKY